MFSMHPLMVDMLVFKYVVCDNITNRWTDIKDTCGMTMTHTHREHGL